MNIDILRVGPLQANCYLVYKDKKCLIIDPGADENFIVSRIRKLELDVVAILITHNHNDHNGCAKDLSVIYGVDIYDFNNLFEQKHFIDPFKFEVIYTPGHTSDSVCYYFYDYGVMFTGDFLFKESIGRTDLPTGDYEEMLVSLKKIREYDDDIKIYPGHGDISSFGYEKENNEYL